VSHSHRPVLEPLGSAADLVSAGGSAEAVGTVSDVTGASDTFLGGGMAGGIAGAMGAAQNTDGSPPHAMAETHGATSGGGISALQTGTMSGELNFGHSSYAGADSVTFTSAVDLAPAPLSLHDSFSTVFESGYGHIA
jgi:hypothetical protein